MDAPTPPQPNAARADARARARSLPIVTAAQPIRRAAEAIDRGVRGIALVVNPAGALIGTITDGDIRRAMLDGVELDAPVRVLLERKRGAAYERPVTAGSRASRAELLELMRERRVRQVPLVDDAGCPVALVTLDELVTGGSVPFPASAGAGLSLGGGGGPLTAVVMAGGKGVRLGPLTASTPKPMLHVGGKPLLEHTIERLAEAGVGSVAISTNYLAEQIREHFGDGARFGVPIRYLDETEPLGTAGSLSLLEPRPSGPVLVLNGDILTSVDFTALRGFHAENRAVMTVAVRRHLIAVPYGVTECDGAVIRSLVEKPTYSVLVNAGIYVLEPGLLGLIPRGQRFDMTEVIEAARRDGGRVCAFPIREYWLDIGRPDDFAQAQRDAAEVLTTEAARRIAS